MSVYCVFMHSSKLKLCCNSNMIANCDYINTNIMMMYPQSLSQFTIQQVTGGPRFLDEGTRFITLVSKSVGNDSFTHIVQVEVCAL